MPIEFTSPQKDWICESTTVRSQDIRRITQTFDPTEDVGYQGVDDVQGDYTIEVVLEDGDSYEAVRRTGTHRQMMKALNELKALWQAGELITLVTTSDDEVTFNPTCFKG